MTARRVVVLEDGALDGVHNVCVATIRLKASCVVARQGVHLVCQMRGNRGRRRCNASLLPVNSAGSAMHWAPCLSIDENAPRRIAGEAY